MSKFHILLTVVLVFAVPAYTTLAFFTKSAISNLNESDDDSFKRSMALQAKNGYFYQFLLAMIIVFDLAFWDSWPFVMVAMVMVCLGAWNYLQWRTFR